MTLDEILEAGRGKLAEYESRLATKIKGTRSYDSRSAKRIFAGYEGDLSAASRELVEGVIDKVLDELVQLNDGFWVVEPEYEALAVPPGCKIQILHDKNLNLTFAVHYSVMDDTGGMAVSCWYEE